MSKFVLTSVNINKAKSKKKNQKEETMTSFQLLGGFAYFFVYKILVTQFSLCVYTMYNTIYMFIHSVINFSYLYAK